MLSKITLYNLLMIFLSSCAIGPLGLHETGRSIGQSSNEFAAGYGHGGYIFKWTHGLSENLDMGIQLESLSLGARLKYSIINEQKYGFSLAAATGLGLNIGGNHYYGDLIGSYLKNAFEPYSGVRIVHVKNNSNDIKNSNGGIVFTYDGNEFEYGQIFIGIKYWISNKFHISIEGSSISSLSGTFKSNRVNLGSIGLGYRF